MDCSEIKNLIPGYCNGELDDETRRQVEEHLDGCPDCRNDLDREQSLGELIGQSADDPPEEYWGDYNDRVRSRIRGALAMSWRMGCLPVLIVAPILGFLAGYLFFGMAMGSRVLMLIVPAVIGVGLAFAFVMIFKYTNRRGLPRYARDEQRLQRVIASNPLLRGTLMAMLILTDLGVSIYLAHQFASNAHLPPAVRFVLGIVLFIGFGSAVTPSYYRQMRDYVTGRTATLLDWSAPRESLRKRLRRRPFMLFIALLLVLLAAWNTGVSIYLDAPDDCRYKAQRAHEKGDVNAAISTLRTCIAKYGERYTVLASYRCLGEIYSEAGQQEQARQVCSEGIEAYERFAEHPKFHYSKQDQFRLLERGAELYIGLGENRKACQLYTAKLRMAPNNAENMYFVAEAYADAGYKDEAVKLYTKLIREHPHGTWAHLAREALQKERE